MILKNDYKATALSHIHHGSNDNTGIVRTFRTEKVKLINPIQYESTFKNHSERRATLLLFLYYIWIKIFNDNNITGGRRVMKIWDEFSTKLMYACKAKDKYAFLNRLCKSWNLSVLSGDIAEIFERFNSDELLETIRNEHYYLVMLLRKISQEKKSKYKDFLDYQMELEHNEDNNIDTTTERPERFDIKKFISDLVDNNNVEEKIFKKQIIDIPYISGNAVGGYLRRLLMRDYLERVGITVLEKESYHQMMTGGTITTSKEFESHEKRAELKMMCPPLQLLGTSIGNLTLESSLAIGDMRPMCREHETGDISFWELLDVNFGTRHDTSKTEKHIELIDKEKSEDDSPHQMLFEYEVLIKGTEFQSSFFLDTNDEIVTSCFWQLIKLFKKYNVVGAKSSRGLGLIDINIEVPKDAEKLYIDYKAKYSSETSIPPTMVFV